MRHPVPTSENTPSRKAKLALAIAQGTSIADWARRNKVPRRTANRWASQPKVRDAIELYRNRLLDQAIGRMANRATWATDRIVKLADSAESESVQLAALRAILSDMMTVSRFSGLARRLIKMEEQFRARTGSTNGQA